MTHIQGQMEQEGTRFHHTMQNGMQLILPDLLISRELLREKEISANKCAD